LYSLNASSQFCFTSSSIACFTSSHAFYTCDWMSRRAWIERERMNEHLRNWSCSPSFALASRLVERPSRVDARCEGKREGGGRAAPDDFRDISLSFALLFHHEMKEGSLLIGAVHSVQPLWPGHSQLWEKVRALLVNPLSDHETDFFRSQSPDASAAPFAVQSTLLDEVSFRRRPTRVALEENP